MKQGNGVICSSGTLSLVRSANKFKIVSQNESYDSTVIFSSWDELLGICIAILRSTEVISRVDKELPEQIQRPYAWLPRMGDQATADHDEAWDEALKEFIPGDVEEFCYQFSLGIGDIVFHDDGDLSYFSRGENHDENLEWSADELFQLVALVLADVRTREVTQGEDVSPYWCPFLLIVVRQLFKLDLSGARQVKWHSPDESEVSDEEHDEASRPETTVPEFPAKVDATPESADPEARLREILDQNGL